MATTRKTYWHLSIIILTTLLFVIALEFVVRILFPQINYQGNQKNLFVRDKFDQTMGLRPNASGIIFGTQIHTDEHGFRRMHTPAQYDQAWLFLGDSVTFGVGVAPDQIFPQLVQNEFPNTRIWNTAVVGYSTPDYLNIAKDFLRRPQDIDRIFLFFCLNDVYPNLSLDRRVSFRKIVLSFLRSNSKLFLLLKKVFLDRSKSYALHDLKLYEASNPDIEAHLRALVEIKSLADRSHAQFIVLILPYEYQLRVGGMTAPQDRLKRFFQIHDINAIDLFEAFSLLDSEDYFLFGDPMHLSPQGHQAVAGKVIGHLK